MSRMRVALGQVAAVSAIVSLVSSARASDEAKLHRFWVGFTFGLTAPVHPSGAGVCDPSSGWVCVQEDGAKYAGLGGHVDGGFSQFGVEAMTATFDVAITDAVMVGARLGFYFHPYSAQANDGLGTYFNIYETRATWLLGSHPLTSKGFRPYVFFGMGLADFSSWSHTEVVGHDANGPQQVKAWRIAGPGFAATGVGIRIGTPRFAMMIAPFSFALPFGAGSAAVFMPEITFEDAPF